MDLEEKAAILVALEQLANGNMMVFDAFAPKSMYRLRVCNYYECLYDSKKDKTLDRKLFYKPVLSITRCREFDELTIEIKIED